MKASVASLPVMPAHRPATNTSVCAATCGWYQTCKWSSEAVCVGGRDRDRRVHRETGSGLRGERQDVWGVNVFTVCHSWSKR